MLVDGWISQDGMSRTAIALLPWYMMILCELILDQFVALLRSIQAADADVHASRQTSETGRLANIFMVPPLKVA